MTEELRGKVAIVTGGGAGIGLAAAEKMAREGASVVICSDREDQAQQAAGGLREESLEITGMRGDVRSSADVKNLVEFAVEAYGGVDVLINRPGSSATGRSRRPRSTSGTRFLTSTSRGYSWRPGMPFHR
jgi:NAD(P)-dependent dehydrogenase (short-subunit alcohol dehydrogenase family)